MKKYNFFNLVFWLVIAVLLFVAPRISKAEEFSKYRKDFEISKSGIINVRTKSSGYIKYKLKKGTYEIDILEVSSSTVMLDDGLETNTGKRYEPVVIESYHYKFIVDLKTTLTLKQGFKTSNKKARFKVTIKRIGD